MTLMLEEQRLEQEEDRNRSQCPSNLCLQLQTPQSGLVTILKHQEQEQWQFPKRCLDVGQLRHRPQQV